MNLDMNKHDNKDDQESLLSVFLSTSQEIDESIDKAKEIIKQEGLDPDKLQREGMSFITSIQKRVRPRPILTIDDLVKKLTKLGFPKTLLEKKIVPSAKAVDWRKQNYPSEIDAIAAFVSAIFGLQERNLWTTDRIALAESPAWLGRFKSAANANVSQIAAYSYYAHYLAKLVVKACKVDKGEQLPGDSDEFKVNYLNKYKKFDLESLLNYAWELGFCVLPLNDPGVFHGACWNIDGRKVIVLKQSTKYHARWIFDLLHEMYHALAHLDEANASVIESEELNPFLDHQSEEEREANTFSRYVLFGNRSEEIVEHSVRLAHGRVENLKSAVSNIARSENLRPDILANLVAYRLSLSNQNWWGAATSFQIAEPDPFTVASSILVKNISIEDLNTMDQSLLKIALSNN